MRILVVVHGFPPAAQGGSEIFAYEHARTLRKRHGDEMLVLTRENDVARGDYTVRRETREGMSIAWVNNTFRRARSFEETYRNAAIDAIARRLIDEFKPDVAHIHHLTCLSTNIVQILDERGVPTVFTLHDYWLICHRGQLLDVDYRVCDGPGADDPSGCHACLGSAAGAGSAAFAAAATVRAIERRLPEAPARHLRRVAGRVAAMASDTGAIGDQAQRRVEHMQQTCGRVTTFLSPSRCVRDRFLRFGIPRDRITLSRYGFDHALFRGRDRTASSQLRLGFLGSLMVSKAPHVLLDAFGRLPRGSATVDLFGAHCAYHGDDTYRDRLRAFLAADGVRVRGPIPHEQVAEALASIDVLVVPSIWPENSPLVIHEAFLAGVPVVASRIGGIPEVVDDRRGGLLFKPGDPEDLHRVLLRLVREPGLLDALRAGIPSVRTIEDDVDFTRRIYEARVAGANARGASRPRARRLAAVVLNYKTPDDTLLAVRSLLASRRLLDDIIVVDNDPDGGCRLALEEVWSKIDYVRTGRNLGFSGGVNVGIRTALERGADAVVLVNSDVMVSPDCLEKLERSLDRVPDAGIAGPVVLARSEPGRIASLGISYETITGRMRHRAVGADIESVDVPAEGIVDAVSGCLMLVRREVFDAVGLFDEDYFFTFEDLDFCLRARRSGFVTVVAGAAAAYHEGSRSIGSQSPQRLYFAARNHLMLGWRTDPSEGRAARRCRTASIVLLNLAHAAISPAGSLAARFRAVAQGTRDYLVGRVGPASDAERLTK